jgi:hypothetical protein
MPAHPLARPEEARAEHVVRAPAGDRLEHALEVRRRVLAVAVEVDGRAVPLVARQLEPGAQRGPESARRFVRDDARAEPPADRRRRVAGAVVHEQRVDPHATGLARDAREHVADRTLLVAGDHDRQAASRVRRLRRLHRGVAGRHERAAASRGRDLDAEKLPDRRRELAYRTRLA